MIIRNQLNENRKIKPTFWYLIWESAIFWRLYMYFSQLATRVRVSNYEIGDSIPVISALRFFFCSEYIGMHWIMNT